jgi:hypothetical protein
MTSRREFLQVGLAAGALPMAARAELVFAPPPAPRLPLYKVLYDTRFPASVTFARRAASGGVPVHGMHGDMTSFWYQDLYHRWQQGPAAIAGLTAHGALFCLERLAWDQRMRVVFLGEHTSSADGAVAHRFEGPASLLRAATRAAAGADWAAGLADVVASCPQGPLERQVRGGARDGAMSPRATLFSWVIAPVARG